MRIKYFLLLTNITLFVFFDQLVLSVSSATVVNTEILPEGQVGVAYSAQIGQENGLFKLKKGNQLPAGLSLDRGMLRGVPAKSGNYGFSFVSSMRDLPASVELPFKLKISSIGVNPKVFPTLQQGQSFNIPLDFVGGVGNIKTAVFGPNWVTVRNNVLVGKVPPSQKTTQISLSVQDQNGNSATVTKTLRTEAPLLPNVNEVQYSTSVSDSITPMNDSPEAYTSHFFKVVPNCNIDPTLKKYFGTGTIKQILNSGKTLVLESNRVLTLQQCSVTLGANSLKVGDEISWAGQSQPNSPLQFQVFVLGPVNLAKTFTAVRP